MNRFLSLVFLTCMSLFTTAQDLPETLFYKLLHGNINSNTMISMNLVRSGDTLYGNYFYYYYEQNITGDKKYQGKIIPLDGTMANPTEFILHEYSGDESYFDGIFISNTEAEGIWHNTRAGKTLEFNLKEKYPAGSVKFDVHYLNASTYLINNQPQPFAEITLLLLSPVDFPDTEIQDSLNMLINDEFFGNYYPDLIPDSLLKRKEAEYFRHYTDANSELYEGGQSFNWEKIKMMNVVFNQDYVCTIEFNDYAFTGGAHGLSVKKYMVVDMINGESVILEELFASDVHDLLVKLINDKIYELYNIPAAQKLTEAGFFYETIEPTSNFYLTKDGIGFYYNNYEIASYATGHTNIFITFDEIGKHIRMNSPAGRILKSY